MARAVWYTGFDTPNNDFINVSVEEWKGHERIDVRVWFKDKDGCLNPTRKGVMIPLECVDDLVKAVTELQTFLAERKTEE